MARNHEDREDLLRDATALIYRGRANFDGDEIFLCFRPGLVCRWNCPPMLTYQSQCDRCLDGSPETHCDFESTQPDRTYGARILPAKLLAADVRRCPSRSSVCALPGYTSLSHQTRVDSLVAEPSWLASKKPSIR